MINFGIPETGKTGEEETTRSLLGIDAWKRYAGRLDQGYFDIARSLAQSLRGDTKGSAHEDEINASNKMLLLMLAVKEGQATGNLDPRAVLRTADLKLEVARRMGVPDNARAAEAVEAAADGTEGMLYALKTLRKEFRLNKGPNDEMSIGLNTALDGKFAIDGVQIIYEKNAEGGVARIKSVNLIQAKRGAVDESELQKIRNRHVEYSRRLISLSEMTERVRQTAEGRIMAELGNKIRSGNAEVTELADPISEVMMEIESLVRAWEQETVDAIMKESENAKHIEVDAETGKTDTKLSEIDQPVTQAQIDFDRISEIVNASRIPSASFKILLRDAETRQILRDYYLEAICINDDDRSMHEEEFQIMVNWAESSRITDEELAKATVFAGVDEKHLSFYELNSIVISDRGSKIAKSRLFLPKGGMIKIDV